MSWCSIEVQACWTWVVELDDEGLDGLYDAIMIAVFEWA